MTYIDIHILQTLPPSNVNRDDTGSPKSARFGGARRTRVSSQAWKKQTREAFKERLDTDQLGVRTKRLVEILAEAILQLHPDLGERAVSLAEEGWNASGVKIKAKKDGPGEREALILVSNLQVSALARRLVEAEAAGAKPDAIKPELRRLVDTGHSVDLALFGRMVADAPDLNVDAACQVAHAISVHSVESEFDYFTAVDDTKGEESSGAGMIGTIEFASSTLYRYATVNVAGLQENLGTGDATREAIAAFIDAFVSSMPTGKQNTFAHRTLPDAVVITLRDDQPINLVAAFERAVPRSEEGYVMQAAERLATAAADVATCWGTAARATIVARTSIQASAVDKLSDGDVVPMNELGAKVGALLAAELVPA